jgi:hypothetical protein
MKTRLTPNERAAWVAAVAVLATSLLWLAVVATAMALRLHGGGVEHGLDLALTVGRALVKAILALAWRGRLVLGAVLAAAAVTGMLVHVPQPGTLAEGRTRHG